MGLIAIQLPVTERSTSTALPLQKIAIDTRLCQRGLQVQEGSLILILYTLLTRQTVKEDTLEGGYERWQLIILDPLFVIWSGEILSVFAVLQRHRVGIQTCYRNYSSPVDHNVDKLVSRPSVNIFGEQLGETLQPGLDRLGSWWCLASVPQPLNRHRYNLPDSHTLSATGGHFNRGI